MDFSASSVYSNHGSTPRDHSHGDISDAFSRRKRSSLYQTIQQLPKKSAVSSGDEINATSTSENDDVVLLICRKMEDMMQKMKAQRQLISSIRREIQCVVSVQTSGRYSMRSAEESAPSLGRNQTPARDFLDSTRRSSPFSTTPKIPRNSKTQKKLSCTHADDSSSLSAPKLIKEQSTHSFAEFEPKSLKASGLNILNLTPKNYESESQTIGERIGVSRSHSNMKSSQDVNLDSSTVKISETQKHSATNIDPPPTNQGVVANNSGLLTNQGIVEDAAALAARNIKRFKTIRNIRKDILACKAEYDLSNPKLPLQGSENMVQEHMVGTSQKMEKSDAVVRHKTFAGTTRQTAQKRNFLVKSTHIDVEKLEKADHGDELFVRERTLNVNSKIIKTNSFSKAETSAGAPIARTVAVAFPNDPVLDDHEKGGPALVGDEPESFARKLTRRLTIAKPKTEENPSSNDISHQTSDAEILRPPEIHIEAPGSSQLRKSLSFRVSESEKLLPLPNFSTKGLSVQREFDSSEDDDSKEINVGDRFKSPKRTTFQNLSSPNLQRMTSLGRTFKSKMDQQIRPSEKFNIRKYLKPLHPDGFFKHGWIVVISFCFENGISTTASITVSAIFGFDTILNLITIHVDEDGFESEILVSFILNLFSFKFLVDFLAVIPWAVVMAGIFQNALFSSNFELIRLIKLVYLPTLFRTPFYKELARLFRRNFGVRENFMGISVFMFALIAFIHLHGSLLYLFHRDAGIPEESQSTSTFQKYSASIWMAMANNFAVTLKDWRPDTVGEQWSETVLCVSSAIMAASITGMISAISVEGNTATGKFIAHFDEMNEYVRNKKLENTNLGDRLRRSFLLKYQGKIFDEDKILSELNPWLRQEILLFGCESILKKVPFFQRGMEDGRDELLYRILATLLDRKCFLPGEEICQQGEAAEEMFFLLEGRVSVKVDGELIGFLNQGSYFGELSMIADMDRDALLTAVTGCQCLVLHRTKLLPVLEIFPEISLQLLEYFNTRMQSLLAAEFDDG
ncbi:anaphase-promoting complex subunit Hcn1 [Entophlyctis luteolus]|nr:anaphase-promoting complex subunit Hcn1 [Entophlyctis luteolus]